MMFYSVSFCRAACRVRKLTEMVSKEQITELLSKVEIFLTLKPEFHRAIPEAALRRCQAVPVLLSGRTLTVAMTRPADPEVIRTLQREIPGFGLEPVVCTQEDYLAFIHRYRTHTGPALPFTGDEEKAKFRLVDGTSLSEP